MNKAAARVMGEGGVKAARHVMFFFGPAERGASPYDRRDFVNRRVVPECLHTDALVPSVVTGGTNGC